MKRKGKKRKTYFSLSIHIGFHKCVKNKLRIMSLIEHTIQTHGNTCPLVFVRNYKPCHIPLSCRHMISAWSRPAYLTIFVVILDWKFKNAPVCLGIANHAICHLEFHNRSHDAKVTRGQNEDHLFVGSTMWGRDLVMICEMSQKIGLYPDF